jgi:hypothetical protein
MNQDLKNAAILKQIQDIEEEFKVNIQKLRDSIKDTSLDNLDLSELDDNYYVDVYYPETIPIPESDETGVEEKFGGQKPFFVNGESWPLSQNDNLPMKFICQFIDPRNDIKIMTRIFIPQDDDLEDAKIMKIEMNETNLANQLIISPPCEDITFKGFKVTEWIKDKELKSYEYIKNNLNITLDFYPLYDKNQYFPTFETKIGGTHQFTQLSNYCDEDFENFFVMQITGCKYVEWSYGDSGIVHLLDDDTLIGDCC